MSEEEPVYFTGGGAGVDTDSEESDSDMSDVASLDSDLEKEQEKSYERVVYKEDLKLLKARVSISSSSSSSRRSEGCKGEAPDDSLSLEFVHGYRGYDCRSNLHYTQSGEIVYHVAALGVVYQSSAHKQRFYSAHSDDILCLCIHPTQDLVASGQIGRDPSVHVWDVVSMETVSVLKGEHTRGVCAVAFSGDGKKLASVGLDDSHCIAVWDWKKGQCLATTRGSKEKVFMILWEPSAGSDLLVAVGVKMIRFFSQAGGGFTSKRGVFGKVGRPTTMLSVSFGFAQGCCYSGGSDGLVYHWAGSTLRSKVEAHKGPVFVIQRVEKGFVSGGKDGVVALWNESFTSCLKTYQLHSSALEGGAGGTGLLFSDLPPVRALALGQGRILVGTKNSEILEIEKSGPMRILIQGHGEGEVWGLSTHPSRQKCITASDDQTIRIWDLATHRMDRLVKLGKPARCVTYSHTASAIAVGMKDGSVVVFDGESLDKLADFSHRKQEISDVKFSPNGKYLAVGSHDNFVDIYNVLTRKRVGICKGASSYITHVDWDTRSKLLQVNTGDREVLYFEAPRGKHQTIGRTDAKGLEWSTWTCVLGDSCVGIWPAYTDVTDVNAACVSHDSHVIATGDDFGYVKLFNYPSPGKHAKSKQYVGHSAHVTNVRFTRDDRQLVSVGGADTSVMVWHHASPRSGDHQPDQSETMGSGAALEVCEDSDTDSEEEGYDSDVEREKKMDYVSKTYADPIRDAAASATHAGTTGASGGGGGDGGAARNKPHLQASAEESSKDAAGRPPAPIVRRSTTVSPKVSSTIQEGKGKDVKDLSLDYVFGYRGFDTRQNLAYTQDGDIIFHAAGAGIVLNPLTRRQSFYLEHNDDIVCLATCGSGGSSTTASNPKLSQVVATGQIGKLAPVHVWNHHTKQTLSILQGSHGTGTCALDFSCSGKMLVCVGLDAKHTVTVWRWAEGSKVASSGGSTRRIFLAKFRPDSDSKFVTVGVKHVCFWTLAGSELLRKRAAIPRDKYKGVALQTMLSLAFAQDDITYTGSVSGDIFVWKGSSLTRLVSRAHSGPIFSMQTCLGDGLVLSGGKDKTKESVVKLWDTELSRSRQFSLPKPSTIRSLFRQKGKILVGTQDSIIYEIEEKGSKIETLMEGHSEGELWGLAASPNSLVFVTASCDKSVCTWDISAKSLLHKCVLEHPAHSADFSPDGTQVAVGLGNGQFLVMATDDLSLLAQRRDHSKPVQAVRFSPDGALLAVGCDDASVDVYSTAAATSGGLKRVGYCRGIPSFVTHIDWSADGRYLQVSTGVYERLVFEAASGKQVTEEQEIEKITWASWTSVLGAEVIGVWPHRADKSDVNTAHLNHSGTALATGDDFGTVKLFDHFPIPERYAPHKKYFGHSAHVTCVRFTHDDRYLLSAGGDDSCVFLWKCLH